MPDKKAAARKAKILVIDDDPSMCELLALHLRTGGYEVLQSKDAIIGAQVVVKSRPDVIVVDVQMPYMSGYELVRTLKEDPATQSIPVVFLTADNEVAREAQNVGARYLTKPVRSEELLRVVREALGGQGTK